MNFLSHYYFTQYANDPYYTLGSMLPDLLRNYGGVWRISPEKERERFKRDPALHALLKGWDLHLQVDKIFHSSPVFIAETGELRKLFVPVFTRLPIRPFFLAHVAYELILDSLLLQEKAVNTANFYQELAACDREIIQTFLIQAGLPDPSAFFVFLDSFLKAKYLESYASSKSVVYALDQIGRRVWHEKFNEQENEAAILVLDRFKKNQGSSFMEVFNTIEKAVR